MRVYLAGHTGMVGSAFLRQLQGEGRHDIITRSRQALDLTRQAEVEAFIEDARPEMVILAAAKVGGIDANRSLPADFIVENLAIQTNVIQASHRAGVQRLLLLGSSCVYPAEAPQPIREEALLTGPLEPTNEAYAIAKIAGIKLCESYNRQYGRDYRIVMPCNLYGPYDNFREGRSHVLPALMRRFHEAVSRGEQRVSVWGSGRPRREFMHVDDMAAASLHLLRLPAQRYQQHTCGAHGHVNVGTGVDCSINDLARLVAEVTGFKGAISFDASMPDGVQRKLLDVSRLHASGWKASIGLEEGVRSTYAWFRENVALARM